MASSRKLTKVSAEGSAAPAIGERLRFLRLKIAGAYLIEPKLMKDERGFFARTFCAQEFAGHGLAYSWVQCSVSFNIRKGTLRGMHLQTAPYPETKLVRCTRGGIYDVLLDLRPDSITFRKWVAVVLTSENRRAVVVPEGVAHGFLTTMDDTEVFYQSSEFYHPECACGVRWNDPAFRIWWPSTPKVISKRDAGVKSFHNKFQGSAANQAHVAVGGLH